jgi:ubiquinone/menaquinone biosynthesis C-methylase UbiE
MKRENDLSVNIGCGRTSDGDVRVDFIRTPTVTVIADALHLPFRENIFTRAYERNLLEHMPNPTSHLVEVRRILKPNGNLELVTDNAACLKYYILGTHTGGYCRADGRDKHYAVFTIEHVRNLLSAAGLIAVKIQLIDTTYFTKFFDRLLRLVAPQLSYPRILVLASKR